jgi:hypothetical protein
MQQCIHLTQISKTSQISQINLKIMIILIKTQIIKIVITTVMHLIRNNNLIATVIILGAKILRTTQRLVVKTHLIKDITNQKITTMMAIVNTTQMDIP